jgi:hypothetical protein
LKKIFYTLASLFLLWSCQTVEHGVLIPETPLNMSDSRKAVQVVIGKPRTISENGRELFSGYYDSWGLDFDPGKSKERFHTHVLILGDRRPYDIRVIVPVEEKRGSSYVRVGYDNDRAKKVSEKIKRALTESRDNRNIIDDFKPY